MKKEIPIMFCFDNNYVIPAAVAFYSLLENCNKENYYKLYILHTDITPENQQKLKETIKKFANIAELIFIDMQNRFSDLWKTIETKGHFSKEVMYKVLVASIFPEYEKIIVSDVDVVFLNDVSTSFIEFDTNEDYYLAGTKMIGKMNWYMDCYLTRFSKKEVEKLSGFCGGYIIFNLKKIRQDDMESKFIECFKKEGYRINQMEQDVLNLCCFPKTKRLPLKYVACAYMWDKYKTEQDKETDANYTKEEINDAMQNTVQLHYATSIKPWKNLDCTKGEEWFKYLCKTPFLKEFLNVIPDKIVIPQHRLENITNDVKKEMMGQYKIPNNNEYKGLKLLDKIRYFLYKRQDKIFFRIFTLNAKAIKLILTNPLVLFKKSFYKKVYRKIVRDKFAIVIFDDVFPSELSPFRFEEYISYFKEFKTVYVATTGSSLPALNEKRKLQEVINEFEFKYPMYKEKVFDVSKQNREKNLEKIKEIKNKIIIITFEQNVINDIYDNLEYIEKNKIPFIFTLYPGGGFILYDEKSDLKLKRICNSKYLKKVIVTQKITKDYLVENNICNSKKIELIFGVVTPEKNLNAKTVNKESYNKNKQTFDVCFVAHKYTKEGKDKGFDLFIDTAKEICKKYQNVKFHVVGGFNENDYDISAIKDNIKFYSILKTEELINLYRTIDVIISPTRPYILSKGSFDGFPTASSTEAMLNKVVLVCTDELHLNNKFIDNKELIIVKPNVEDIVEKIEFLYNNPKQLMKISKAGLKKVKKVYSYKSQICPRIKIIRQIAKELK